MTLHKYQLTQFQLFSAFHSKLFHGFFDNSLNAVDSLDEVKNYFSVDQLFHVTQVHGDTVVILDENNLGDVVEADAIITSLKNVVTVIKVADCQAIQVYDPVENQIANIHAGWRGVINNILPTTLKQMKGNPKDFFVGIGPSLGSCCAEFSDPKNEVPEEFHKYINKSHVDLWTAVEDQLIDFGVQKKNIERMRICTKCDERFFSHRRGDKGRLASVMGLLSK